MSKQISFYILPDELIELEALVKKRGGVFVLRNSPVSDIIIVDDVFKTPYLGAYILPKGELINVVTKKVAPDLYVINSSVSPIVEFSQGIIKDGALRATRLLFHKEYYQGDESINFSLEYITWCEEVFDWIRKNYKPCKSGEYKGYRISSHVLNMINNNELKLSSH